MARMTGSWMSGPRAALPRDSDGTENRYKGERLGLPEDGPGALAGTWRRVGGLTVDWLLALALAFAVTAPDSPGNLGAALWAVLSVVSVLVLGRTVGQTVVGVGVARVDAEAPVGLWRSVARVALVFLLVPPLVTDLDGRGLQDRATGTAVIRSR